MNAEKRRQHLLEKVNENGFISISDEAQAMGVSVETIRRDIDRMAGNKQLLKVRGGAAPARIQLRRDAEYMLRRLDNQQVKMSIGRAAASMITDGQVVFLDCGTSIQDIAKCISGVRNVTFVVNSVPVMSILLNKFAAGEIDGRAIMIGGEMDVHNRFTKGAGAVAELEHYSADIAFISCTAVSAQSVSGYTLDEGAYSAKLIQRAVRSVLVAESNKLGKTSLYAFARPGDFSCMITDDTNHVPDHVKNSFAAANVHTVVVSERWQDPSDQEDLG
jgi:DeoR/GlpR family transcriptional regulator of sugar metabolism